MSLAACKPSSLRFRSICLLRARAARSSADIAQPIFRPTFARAEILTRAAIIRAGSRDSHETTHYHADRPSTATTVQHRCRAAGHRDHLLQCAERRMFSQGGDDGDDPTRLAPIGRDLRCVWGWLNTARTLNRPSAPAGQRLGGGAFFRAHTRARTPHVRTPLAAARTHARAPVSAGETAAVSQGAAYGVRGENGRGENKTNCRGDDVVVVFHRRGETM